MTGEYCVPGVAQLVRRHNLNQSSALVKQIQTWFLYWPLMAFSVFSFAVGHDDLALGTIAGHTLLNNTLMPMCIALCGPGVVLYWWDLSRDTFAIAVAIFTMVGMVSNGNIDLTESVVLCVMYMAYCIILAFDRKIFVSCLTQMVSDQKPVVGMQLRVQRMSTSASWKVAISLVIAVNVAFVVYDLAQPGIGWIQVANDALSSIFLVEAAAKMYAFGIFGYWVDSSNSFDGMLASLVLAEFLFTNGAVGGGVRSIRFLRLFRALSSLRAARMVRFAKQDVNNKVAPLDSESTTFTSPSMASMHDLLRQHSVPEGDHEEEFQIDIAHKPMETDMDDDIECDDTTSANARFTFLPPSIQIYSTHIGVCVLSIIVCMVLLGLTVDVYASVTNNAF